MNFNSFDPVVPKAYEEVGALVESRAESSAALTASDVILVLAKAVEPMNAQESETFISELGLLSILVAREALLITERAGNGGVATNGALVSVVSGASGLAENETVATLSRLQLGTEDVMEFGTPALIAAMIVPYFLGCARDAMASLEAKIAQSGVNPDVGD